jgi:HK97 family phage portal protein
MSTFVQRILNPVKELRAAIYSKIGPAKDWSTWQTILFSASRAKVTVNWKTSQSIPAYFRAVTILSEQIASLPFSVYTKDAAGNIIEDENNSLWPLINYRPDPNVDKFTFFETLVRQLFTGGPNYKGGNALIHIMRNGSGQVDRLHLITEDWDQFETGGKHFYNIKGMNGTIPSADIIHLRMYSSDTIIGNSLQSYHQDTLGRGIAEIQHGANFYGNGAQIGGVLETDQPLNKEQRDLIQESWNRNYGGPDNSGKTALLSNGVKYKATGKAVDGNDIDARKLTVDDIANITGIPTFLLGKTETFGNTELLNRIFVQYTLRSWCKRIESEFNSKLFPKTQWGKTFVKFDLDGLLQGDTDSRAKYYATMYNIRALNPNEIRSKEGLNSYEGGDTFGQPLASNSTETITQTNE